MKFDGSGDYTLIDDEIFATRTGDFQVQFWVYQLDTSDRGYFHCGTNPTGSSTNGYALASSGGAVWSYHTGYTQGGTVSANTWNHLAFVRRDGRMNVFVNGTKVINRASTEDYTGTKMFLGGYYSTSNVFNGYIEDFQFLRGHTTYPNENPSEKHTAVTNTKIQFANTTSIPSSVNSLAVTTTTGTPVRTAFSPVQSDVGTSFYYSNACNKIAYSADALNWGTGDFTVQWWLMIPVASSGPKSILDTRVTNATSQAGWTLSQDSTNLYIYSGGSGNANHYLGNIPFEYGKWSYYTFQRASGTSSIYVNGILHATSTLSRTFSQTDGFYVGGLNTSELHPNVFVADLRIIKGTALYSDSFTPPSSAL